MAIEPAKIARAGQPTRHLGKLGLQILSRSGL